ncbi:hypothetical protein SAMN05519104_7553 [Rhizobiales bacterium GAS188]|nr:hypothetical protein SAMN05519104_7553 [Rhizobiales bacterium GAS188]
MNGWLEDAITMERRHILEGEKRVARQEALVAELIGKRRDDLARTAKDVLGILRESLELSRTRLRTLEGGLCEPPNSN